jgi:hypothetical protein
MLALVAASLVAAYDPSWLAAPVAVRARQHGVRPDRVSRVKARVLAFVEVLVARASRRGRPAATGRADQGATARLRAAEALLAVVTSVVARLGVAGRALQDELVAAYERLSSEHGTDLRSFCAALGLPERTFRSWRDRPPRPPAPPPPAVPAAPRPPRPRRGRFALEVLPPGVVAAADTSDWELFGVPLKILAVQDPGARGLRTWEAGAVETGEDAQKVVDVVRDALGERPGTQLVTDQGTPYLAEAARAAYEELGLEHAPQKEADPLGKGYVAHCTSSVRCVVSSSSVAGASRGRPCFGRGGSGPGCSYRKSPLAVVRWARKTPRRRQESTVARDTPSIAPTSSRVSMPRARRRAARLLSP